MREKSRRPSPGGGNRTEEMAEEGVRAMLVMECNDCKIILQQECTFFSLGALGRIRTSVARRAR
jgi:hypothetical protein